MADKKIETKKEYLVQTGCFMSKDEAKERLKLSQLKINPNAWTYTNKKGTHVIVGSFINRFDADALAQSIVKRNICEVSVEIVEIKPN